jgi:hypothetical protein
MKLNEPKLKNAWQLFPTPFQHSLGNAAVLGVVGKFKPLPLRACHDGDTSIL